jgi:hypothetical protein
VSAIIELLKRDKHDDEEIFSSLARKLDALHYKTPRGRKSGKAGEISSKTLRTWYEETLASSTKSLQGRAYQEFIELGELRRALGDSYSLIADKMVAGLAQDLPGGPLRLLPLVGDPPVRKR